MDAALLVAAADVAVPVEALPEVVEAWVELPLLVELLEYCWQISVLTEIVAGRIVSLSVVI
jgi:hypothetical protein